MEEYLILIKTCPECEAFLREYDDDGYEINDKGYPVCPCCGYEFEYETEYIEV